MNVNHRYEIRGLQRQILLERESNLRIPITRGRKIESDIDWSSTNVTNRSLIDPVTGRFYFIVGVSEVGGGDVIRSEDDED